MSTGGSEALALIAQVQGCSIDEARAYCLEVQRHCDVLPSFWAIAQVVERHGSHPLKLREVANEASGLRKIPVAEPDEPSPTERVVVPSIFEIDLDDYTEGLQTCLEPLIESVTRSAIRKLVIEPIEGLIIGFTGNGPYHETDLEKLAMRLGATPDRDGIEWDDLDWIVVGRDEYDPQYLAHSVEVGGIRHLTQEAFMGLVFMGESLDPECSDESHPGYAYLGSLADTSDPAPQQGNSNEGREEAADEEEEVESWDEGVEIHDETPTGPTTLERTPPITRVSERHSIVTSPTPPPIHPAPEAKGATSPTARPGVLPPGWSGWGHPPRASAPDPAPEEFRWPVVSGEPSRQSASTESPALNVESDLKKLGYSVARDVSIHERRKVLEYAVRNLGLKKVANHLAFLIRYFQTNPGKHDAVGNWRDDLAWLQSRDWVRPRY